MGRYHGIRLENGKPNRNMALPINLRLKRVSGKYGNQLRIIIILKINITMWQLILKKLMNKSAMISLSKPIIK